MLTTVPMRPHLSHEAKNSLLRRASEYEEKDWNVASKFERHAINAVLDLENAELRIQRMREALMQARAAFATISNNAGEQHIKEFALVQFGMIQFSALDGVAEQEMAQ